MRMLKIIKGVIPAIVLLAAPVVSFASPATPSAPSNMVLAKHGEGHHGGYHGHHRGHHYGWRHGHRHHGSYRSRHH